MTPLANLPSFAANSIPRKPETEEQRKKRERREKWSGIISGISDMARAIGNLYYTTKGAPNGYDPKVSMSAKARERWEKAKAERDKDADRYYRYAMGLSRLNGTDRNYELQRDAEERKNRNLARLERKQEWDMQVQQGKFDIARERLRIDEEYKQGLITAKQRDSDLRELEVYNRVYGSSTTTQTGPKGTTVTVRVNNKGKDPGKWPSGQQRTQAQAPAANAGNTAPATGANVTVYTHPINTHGDGNEPDERTTVHSATQPAKRTTNRQATRQRGTGHRSSGRTSSRTSSRSSRGSRGNGSGRRSQGNRNSGRGTSPQTPKQNTGQRSLGVNFIKKP